MNEKRLKSVEKNFGRKIGTKESSWKIDGKIRAIGK